MIMRFAMPVVMTGFLLLGNACQHHPAQEQPIGSTVEEQAGTPQILKLHTYHYADTVGSDNQRYVYDIVRKAVDSLAVVEDENGDRYADNLITLNIRRNGSPYFMHTFSKKSFNHYLSPDFRKHAILEGMAFDRMINGVPRFAASVGIQYSDMSMPFLITIHSDGHFTITRDEVLDNIVETMDTTELD